MEEKKRPYEPPTVIVCPIGSDLILASDPWEDWGELVPFVRDW